ncbi:SufE family protein [Rhodococcus antarcticus]|uniref:SufE family protein n=1 Tax=Rhodococcus antarcticus TaxID=2987751 RepID=A0ABY6P1H8_9NOCA|nr:SufE family protein [Rhodococcus antarcticus]UZJ25502.1 SufE family protein [Rhodococcus antarcticus]
MSIPSGLQEVIEDFEAVEGRDKLTLLLELSDELPELPDGMETADLERVPECQTPLFLTVDAADAEHVKLYFQAPPEAPTTRGFAAILHHGLDGESRETVLAVPEDFYATLGLADVVSPLRLRGLSAMLARIKRQVREAS